MAPVEITNESLGIFPSWPCSVANAVGSHKLFRMEGVRMGPTRRVALAFGTIVAQLRV